MATSAISIRSFKLDYLALVDFSAHRNRRDTHLDAASISPSRSLGAVLNATSLSTLTVPQGGPSHLSTPLLNVADNTFTLPTRLQHLQVAYLAQFSSLALLSLD